MVDERTNTRISKLEVAVENMTKILLDIRETVNEIKKQMIYNEYVENKIIIPINTDLEELDKKISDDKVFANHVIKNSINSILLIILSFNYRKPISPSINQRPTGAQIPLVCPA